MKNKIIVMETLLRQAGIKYTRNNMNDMEYYNYLDRLCLDNINHMVLLELGL